MLRDAKECGVDVTSTARISDASHDQARYEYYTVFIDCSLFYHAFL